MDIDWDAVRHITYTGMLFTIFGLCTYFSVLVASLLIDEKSVRRGLSLLVFLVVLLMLGGSSLAIFLEYVLSEFFLFAFETVLKVLPIIQDGLEI